MMQDDSAGEIDLDPVLLRKALSVADIPTLVALLAEFTGDEKWLAEPFLPARAKGMDSGETGGLPEEVQDEIRSAAHDAIMAKRKGLLSRPFLDESDLVR